MENEALLLMLAVLLILALFILGIRNVEVSGKRAQYAQALFTLLAFMTTAYWFFVERKGMPHADVTQELVVVPVGGGLAAVEAHIKVENLGQRLLRVEKINSRLQLIRPDAYDYSGLNRKKDDEYWLAKRPDSDSDQFLDAELRWPISRQYKKEVDHRIEPGETDLIVVTYLVSCSAARWVRVASDIYNPAAAAAEESEEGDDSREGFAWKTRSFADLQLACSNDEGDRS